MEKLILLILFSCLVSSQDPDYEADLDDPVVQTLSESERLRLMSPEWHYPNMNYYVIFESRNSQW